MDKVSRSMPENEGPSIGAWPVDYDAKVTAMASWKLGISKGTVKGDILGLGVYTGLFFMAGAGLANESRTLYGPGEILVITFLIGLIGGSVFWAGISRLGYERLASKGTGQRWDCWMTDTHWHYRDLVGVEVSAPWSGIQLLTETADAFVVRVGPEPIIVFRSPLKQAGLDEVFRAKVTAQA